MGKGLIGAVCCAKAGEDEAGAAVDPGAPDVLLRCGCDPEFVPTVLPLPCPAPALLPPLLPPAARPMPDTLMLSVCPVRTARSLRRASCR